MPTFAESAEQLKQQYTDKYVKVDPRRPELARFRDVVGQVKTVNMNGRALVQFLNYHQNVGWHDIDLSCLTVVEAPQAELTEKAEPKRAHDKPAGKAAPTSGAKQTADAKATPAAGAKKLSPLELARLQGAGGKGPAAAPAKAAGEAPTKASSAPASGAKKSTADILAMARGGAAPAAAPGAAQPAAAKAAPAPPKPQGGKMSTADILAAAREKATASAAAATAPTATKPQAPAAPSSLPAPVEPAPAGAGGVVKVDKSGMSVGEMIAYCRAKDKS